MKPEQITAWALEEASAEERQQFEAELRDNPTARQAAEETKDFCHFLLAELKDESLALSDTQRERLQARLPATAVQSGNGASSGVASPLKAASWRSGVVMKLAMAASIAFGGFWVWQALPPHQTDHTLAAAWELEGRTTLERGKNASSPEKQPVVNAAGLDGLSDDVDRFGLKLPDMAVEAKPVDLGIKQQLVRNEGKETSGPAEYWELRKLQVQTDPFLRLNDAQSMPAGPAVPQPGPAGGKALSVTTESLPALRPLKDELAFVGGSVSAGVTVERKKAPAPGSITALSSDLEVSAISPSSRPMLVAAPAEALGEAASGTSTFAAVALPKAEQLSDSKYFIYVGDQSRLEQGELEDFKGRRELTRNEEVRRHVALPPSNESYTRIIENELKDVAREPLSTLSIDVDTASYANVRRFLNQNTIPPPDAVRIEELVNYFPTAEEGPAHDAKEPFGVRVEMAPCPWQPAHRLARIAIKGRELGNERKNSNLVFLVDVSGSMNEPNKLPLVQQSLRMLTEQLGEGDRVTMVVYAGSSGLVLPPTNGEKKSVILAAIDKLKAGGSTHGSAGIQLAYEQAVAGFIKEGVNRVILCTDGDFNVGVSSPEELEKLITQKAKSGVFLSVLGFGSGNLKDRTMETLADKGNGNYAYIDSLSEARKVLVEQMSGTLVTIAKDVKIQVEFNPAAVRSYRLIGYENRLLAKEDFNDDTKDAGEIGAGHSVVALYEIVPANLPPGTEPRPLVDGLKYQTASPAPLKLAEAAQSGELMTVKLRYKEPEGDTSKLIEVPTRDEGKTLTASTEEFKFSAAVAGFGLLLRDSAYKGTLSWETVRRLALDGKGADKLGYRGEFLQLIDKARGLKETRP